MSRSAVVTRERLFVERLGHRGEGVARGRHGPVYVPYALPGDRIVADVEGERGTLVSVEETAAHRPAPFCRHFGACGGCAVQTLAPSAYAAWKRAIVTTALANVGITAEVDPLVDAHGAGRRRATFHARWRRGEGSAAPAVGFMLARGHAVVDLDACPILGAARSVAQELGEVGRPLDIAVTATRGGLDIDLRGCGELPVELTQKLSIIAEIFALARISNHGQRLIERHPPFMQMGLASVVLPPGAFIQATEAGEALLAEVVTAAVASAGAVADLFCGIGTFALRLAEQADVHAVEMDEAALGALAKAARGTPGLHSVLTERRDLFTRPLARSECDRFEAIVFDPPRSGAEAQARELAAARTPTIVAVSCNAATFARDAKILLAGGYMIEQIVPIDQFRHSAHVEIVGIFRRQRVSVRRRRILR
jgi:23S rRNA (uracil1939-C5)-methyltransferase